jgi:hypothetical protein
VSIAPTVWVYLNEMHARLIGDMLGGRVWIEQELLHWRPEGAAVHVTIPYQPPSGAFDPEEYALALWEGWKKSGAKL